MLMLALMSGAFAQTAVPEFLRSSSSPPQPEARSWALLESETGWLIASKIEHDRVDPASITKLMTSYLAFEALSNGKVKSEDKVYISKQAWKAPGSRMFLDVDTSVSMGELIKGLIIQSGNDAALAIAEYLGGSVSGFANLMNDKAAELGMVNTHYMNASGLPTSNHYTTAYDTALLSRAIIQNFSDLYVLFSVREYTYNDIKQPNRNGLLWRDDSFDGLKTGHTKAAGYCLAGSALRGNTRFIGVVMGAQSKKGREQGVQALIEYGFSQYETVSVFEANTTVKTLDLFKGEHKTAALGSPQAISVLMPRGQAQALELSYELPEKLVAPLQIDDEIGQVNLSFKGNTIGFVPLMPLQNQALGPIWSQLLDAIKIKLF